MNHWPQRVSETHSIPLINSQITDASTVFTMADGAHVALLGVTNLGSGSFMQEQQ